MLAVKIQIPIPERSPNVAVVRVNAVHRDGIDGIRRTHDGIVAGGIAISSMRGLAICR